LRQRNGRRQADCPGILLGSGPAPVARKPERDASRIRSKPRGAGCAP